jgi:hypothetical protein
MLACHFSILEIRCGSTTIISRVNSRVLPLLLLVTFPALVAVLMKLADPFNELTHSCEAVVYMIVVYISGLKCTIFQYSILNYAILSNCRMMIEI